MSHLGLGTSFCSCALASQALALPGDANEDRLQVGLIQSLAGQKKNDGSPTSWSWWGGGVVGSECRKDPSPSWFSAAAWLGVSSYSMQFWWIRKNQKLFLIENLELAIMSPYLKIPCMLLFFLNVSASVWTQILIKEGIRWCAALKLYILLSRQLTVVRSHYEN